MPEREDPGLTEDRPEARLGAALRDARTSRGVSLRSLARKLYRSHSNLVEYERGHRLAPLVVVEAYERELDLTRGTLTAIHEKVQTELSGWDRSPQRPEQPSANSHTALHQLPAHVAAFTGREAELAWLRDMVADNTAVGAPVVISAIAGMAGVGKTALAVHLGHQLAPQFPDAQLYVDLHGYEPRQRLSAAQALDRFLRALGMSAESLPTDVEEQAARYRALLSGKRALVILDNASSAEQVRPLLPGSPTCFALITSRDRLLGLIASEGARLLDLDVLSGEEALELLGGVVGHERVRAEPEAAAEIARRCGYLPLAVRIVAARLAARPSLRISEIAERLSDEDHRLGELEAGDRQVRASFDLSYKGLDAAVARAFRHLGLVAGPDVPTQIAAVAFDASPKEAEALLEALVDAHLLEPAPTAGRYRFHDLLRLYAREQVLAEEDPRSRNEALARTLGWYLGNADVADGLLIRGRRRLTHDGTSHPPSPAAATQAEALAWFEQERGNLVAAIRQAAECGLHAVAWQLADAMFAFYFVRSHWADWEETHTVALAAARSARDRRAEAWMLSSLGYACGDLHRFQDAIGCYEQSLAISRQIGDLPGESRTLNYLGEALRGLGRLDEAAEHHERARAMCRETGDRWRESWSLTNLGETYRRLRRFDDAIACYGEALTTWREVGDRWGESRALINLGETYRWLQRFDKAIGCYQQALMICREIGYRQGEGMTLQSLGFALRHAHGLDAARACWREALEIFTELGAPEADEIRAWFEGDVPPGEAG